MEGVIMELKKENEQSADRLIQDIEENKYYNDIFKVGYKQGVQDALNIKRPNAEPQTGK